MRRRMLLGSATAAVLLITGTTSAARADDPALVDRPDATCQDLRPAAGSAYQDLLKKIQEQKEEVAREAQIVPPQ